MTWNNNIRDINNFDTCKRIYYVEKAQAVFTGKNYRSLSLRKQENIRMAIQEERNINDIVSVMSEYCGYCFRYCSGDNLCEEYPICPLFKLNGTHCYELDSIESIHGNLDYNTLGKLHKTWCKKLNLWQEHWV